MLQSDGQPQPFMKRYLDARAFKAIQFAINGTFLGMTSGPVIGGATAVMSNVINTPAATTHVKEATKLFGVMGLVYGLTGASLIAVSPHVYEDLEERVGYQEKMVAGCMAGISAGLTRKSVGLACGGCIGVALTVGAWEAIHLNDLTKPSPYLQEVLKPQFKDDEAAHWQKFNEKYYSDK